MSYRFEMSEVQKGIYFDCCAGESSDYNIILSLEVNRLDLEALEYAANLVASEQESLHLKIVDEDNKIEFECCEDSLLKVLSCETASESETEKAAEEFFMKPFDFEVAPLMRIQYIEEGKKHYYLLVCMHHLISDGISTDIFIRKLFKVYQEIVTGTPFQLDMTMNNSYSEFVKEEAIKLANNEYGAEEKYWLDAVENISAPELIKEYTDEKTGVSRAEVRIKVPTRLESKVVKTASELEVSEFMLQAAVYMTALMKTTQSRNFAITTPFTYRPNKKDEEAMGCYIYNYPLFCRTKGEDSFGELARSVKKDIFMGYMNVGYPSNKIAREMNTRGSENANIFDYTFIYDAYEEYESEYIIGMKDWKFCNYPGELTVIYQKIGKEALIRIQFKETDYSREYMDLLGRRMIRIIEQITKNPEMSIDAIDVFVKDEKDQIEEYETENCFFPYIEECAIDIFEKKVAEHTNECAVITDTRDYTYDEINKKANIIAGYLLDLDKEVSEKRAAIYMNRSVNMVVTVLGILKAGWTYVPMDISYTDQRMQYIQKDADIKAVFTEEQYLERLEKIYDIPVNCVEKLLEKEGCENPKIERHPEYAAYIEYTSGSTGEPKGVIVENRNVVNTVKDLERRFPLEKEDVYLFKTSITFDISGTEIYGWIVGDGKLCVLNANEEKDVFAILDNIEKNKVTHINFVPSMLRIFVDCLESKENQEKVASLKWIFTGGEAIDYGLVNKFVNLGLNINLENVYGPTEATMWATHYPLRKQEKTLNVPVGKALNEYKLYVVDSKLNKQPIMVPGELCISGAGVARGYLNKPELTNKVFIDNPFWKENEPDQYKRLYRTGDLARMLPNGNFEFLGRIDSQVKLNGMRIELGEIENVFAAHSEVTSCVCLLSSSNHGESYLSLFYTSKEALKDAELREFASDKINSAFIPSRFVHLEKMPRTLSEKIDRKALLRIEQETRQEKAVELPTNELELMIKDIWKEVLGRDNIDVNENFFEAGGHSIALVHVHNTLCRKLNKKFPISVLLNNPTIKGIASILGDGNTEVITVDENKVQVEGKTNDDVAIVGMAINVPGASSIHEFWNNLVEGKDCIHEYTDEELRELGIDEELINNPYYVRRKGRINDIDTFDPAFFKVTPSEVRMMSPQLRVLYKGVWQALEDAGEVNKKYKDSTGVYIGASDDFAWYQDRMFNNERYSDTYQIYTQSTNHFLATRMSYMFDLMGPAMSVLTGCSTSLATVHLAYKALQQRECNVAIAGGVTIELPNEGGYLYEPNLMFSKDGRCKPFDDRADGTVFSNGMGVVVMKRLEDARRDKDHIYAVIKGSAVRNDGRSKLSYTAPSAQGQALTMKDAYEAANISPKTVGYIEAHGTGTKLGDPIEVDSLTRIFGNSEQPFCVLGSVKGNIGHTDTAAGIVGLIKTALILEHKYIPATVNYEIPNKNIDFENTPFKVINYGTKWERMDENTPRRAGINAFGVGGTNVHMVLEEENDITEENRTDNKYNLFTLSATSLNALKNNLDSMSAFAKTGYMKGRKTDTALTLLKDRDIFAQKGFVVTDNDEAVELFANENTKHFDTVKKVFMFTGQGSQYQGMARELLENKANDRIAEIFKNHLQRVIDVIPEAVKEEYLSVIFGYENPDMINQTKYSQLALFMTEYAMACTLRELGIKPDVLVGHSIGEVAAAAFAGVWSIEDAVKVVIMRALLMQKQNPGSMLSVALSKENVQGYVDNVDNVWISLCNSTNTCVVGGYTEAIEKLKANLDAAGVENTMLKTSHAFHTPMMQNAADEFSDFLKTIDMNDPEYPIVSNLTGKFIEKGQMNKPEYWSKQIIHTVEFEQVLENALEQENTVCYELAGRTLCSLAKKHKDVKEGQTFISCLRHPKEKKSDVVQLLSVVGKSWSAGVEPDWDKVYETLNYKKVYAPAYQFEKKDFPIKLKKSKTVSLEEVEEIDTFTTVGIKENDVLDIVKNAFIEVFEMDEVNEDSDFFEIGGDSMQAASLAALLKKKSNYQLSVSEIFTNPTVKLLAEIIKTKMKENPIELEAKKINKAEKADYYPTTPAQKRMYMLYAMNRSNLAFNLPSITLIKGDIDLEKAKSTCDRLLARHDILRTSFEMKNDEIVQVIHEKCETPFEVEHIEGEFDTKKIVEEFVRPFELDKAPLMRTKLVQNGKETLMLFDVHHIIADGTAVELLTRDFNLLYSGEMETQELQYKDYAVWLKDYNKSDAMKKQEAYWLEDLKGDLPYLELPVDYPRPASKAFEGKRFEFAFGDELSKAIGKRAKELGVTNNILVMSAWNILLSKFTGESDVIIGTSVSGRSKEEIAECIGMFVNMLVIRTYPEDMKLVTTYINEVKQKVMGALENQDYQFDELVDKLNVPRRLDHNAIFDVGFDYHNIVLHDFEIDGLTFEQKELDTGRVSNEILLTCIENNEHQINGFFDYCTAIFKEEFMEVIKEAFIKVLEEITLLDIDALRKITISDIGITSDKEKAQIEGINKISYKERNYKRSIVELFEECAKNKPDETAIITSDGSKYSYSEVKQKVDNIASVLVEREVKAGDNVVIIPKRDETMIAALFAVLKTGATYVPVDITYPDQRIEDIIEQSQARLILGDESVKNKYAHTEKFLEIHECANASCNKNIDSAITHDEKSVAYILFTSGSTGKPKGVLVTRKNLLNFIYDTQERKLIGEPNDRVLCITSPSFDIFGYESITPLCSGSSIYICDQIEQIDAKKTGEKIEKYQVTHILSAVSRLKAFVENKDFARAFKSLRCILGGGENYPSSLLKFLQDNTSARIFNLYGPTETTIWSTSKELTLSNGVNIGNAIANTQLYILDDKNRLLPRGVYGELCIAGDGVSDGYLNRDEENRKHFVTCEDISNSRIYKTGDKGRMLPTGEIELVGRMDYQVKHHGCRIELTEIENIVINGKIAQDAVAVLKKHQDSTQLYLFYVSEEEKDREIKEFISKNLPVYMIPDMVERLNNLPMTHNGKTDRKYLENKNIEEIRESYGNAEPVVVEKKEEVVKVETSGATNIDILNIWKEVLHNDNIQGNSNFFEVGGNSYSLMLVSNKIAEVLGQSVDLSVLFEYPTVDSFCEHMGLNQKTKGEEIIQVTTKEETIKGEITNTQPARKTGKIAVIGMAGRFPGANNVTDFWNNIEQGKECIRRFENDELVSSGINPKDIENAAYVKAKGFLDGVEYFDPEFFGIAKRDANIMDPQIRMLMQTCYNALEDANIVIDEYKGDIALFAGSSSNLMWMTNFSGNSDIVDVFSDLTANDKDFLTTQISYKLNLTGPSMNVQTACSTSLVAICQAAQCLLNEDADVALAGGVSITLPRKEGYLWHENMIYSKDGHCRPFSDDASGTVAGNGSGVVVLKPLEKAIEDNDDIYAVIDGFATNNDGIGKVGYSAPSIVGQKKVIEKALKRAEVSPENIGFIETHGTGTKLGDPIEIEALKQAWKVDNKKYCALGSVKANVGHLDAAAGVTGFIKAVKVLQERVIPPMVNFKEPNELLHIDSTPFYVPKNKALLSDKYTNVAVSAFGIGGTNAHAILGEAPKRAETYHKDELGIFLFSAKTENSLRNTVNEVIEDYVEAGKNTSDVAYTLSVGRKHYPVRTVIVAKANMSKEELLDSMSKPEVLNETKEISLSVDSPAATCEFARLLLVGKAKHEGVKRFRNQITKYIEANECNKYGGLIEDVLYAEESIEDSSYSKKDLEYVSAVVVAAAYKLLKHYEVANLVIGKDTVSALGKAIISMDGNLEDALEGFDNKELSSETKGIKFFECTNKLTSPAEAQMLLLNRLGYLWMTGNMANTKKLNHGEKIHIPGYVFEKEEYLADVNLNREVKNQVEEIKTFNSEEEVFETFKKIWEAVLGEKDVERQRDFFEAGGESLKSIRMAALIEKYYGIKLSQDSLFEENTAGDISNLIYRSLKVEKNKVKKDEIKPVLEQDFYETSSAQKRQYILQSSDIESTAYNLAAAYIVEGVVDNKKIQETLDKLVQRHEALRTYFEVVEDSIMQKVEKNVVSTVEFENAPNDRKTVGEYLEEFVRPFDLSKASLFRMKLVSLSKEKHYLLIDMHHIISDQSSIDVLMRDFYGLYQGMTLEPMNIQFKDFAKWQNDKLNQEESKKQLQYWINQIEPDAVLTNLYHDFAMTSKRTGLGKKISFEIPDMDTLERFARENGLTPYMVMFTALELLMWKYTGQKSFIIGTGLEGRNHEQLHNLVGMFVNTLPICVNVDEDKDVYNQLMLAKQKILEMFENQDCQYDSIVDEFRRQTGITEPLIKVMMNFVSRGTDEIEMDGLRFEPYESDEITAKFDLMFVLEKNKNKYGLDIEFATELFSEETIKQMGRRFIAVLNLLMTDIKLKLEDLTIPFSKEDIKTYEIAKDTNKLEQSKSIAERFEEIAGKYPGYTAVEYDENTLNYEEFNNACDALAVELQKRGVERFNRVALMLEPGFAQLAAIFATLKCGACYVPIDINYPMERIAYMLEDSKAVLVITQKEYENLLESNIQTLVISDEDIVDKKDKSKEKPVRSELSIDDEAYIIYTSGSTGKPKGVSVNGRSILRIGVNPNFNEIKPGDCMPQIANYAFDASILEIFTAMLNGGYNLVIPKKKIMILEEFSKLLRKQRINSMFFTAALFNIVVDYDIELLRNIDRIFVGGEALSVNHIRKALDILGPGHLFNGYGPTETTVFATTFPINEVADNAVSIPIGFAVTDTKLYVMDNKQRILPPGMIGELWVGGSGVANGYVNNEELTNERFRKITIDGNVDKIYKTGDRVILHENGEVVYLGRSDSQVKINGYRIELSEVENNFSNIEGIKESVILVHEDQRQAKSIVAYYTVKDESFGYLTPQYIRKYMEALVPKYLIPAKMIKLKEIPLNANKKVDRMKLINMQGEIEEATIEIKTISSKGNAVLEVMRGVLENNEIQGNDNFFFSGGTSIKAIVMSQRLKEKGFEVSVNDILTHPTANEISTFLGLEEGEDEKTFVKKRGLTSGELDGILDMALFSSDMLRKKLEQSNSVLEFPMTMMQKAHLENKNRASGMSIVLHTNKNVDEVKAAIISEIEAQQLLHSTADYNNKTWTEREVLDNQKSLAQYVYVLDAREYEKDAVAMIKNKLYQKFLTSVPKNEEVMWRLACIRESQKDYCIIWTFDHIAFDATSSMIIKRNLAARLSNSESQIIKTQKYSDYVEGLENLNSSSKLETNIFEKWLVTNEESMDRLKELKGTKKEIDLFIPRKENQEDFVNIAFKNTYELLSRYLGMDEIPMMILKNGRKVEDTEYDNCVGEFLDMSMVLANEDFIAEHAGKDISEYGTMRLFQQVNDNSQFLRKQNAGVNQYILWNYQGEVSSEERKVYAQAFDEEVKELLSEMIIATGVDEDGMYIHLESASGVEVVRVEKAIKEIGMEIAINTQEENIA